MKRSAFTLVEIVTSIAIVTIVAAIVFPATVRAIGAARISSSLERLKALHTAAKIYQEEYGGDGAWGSCYEMNLPNIEQLTRSRLGLSEDAWHSPCSPSPRWSYMYFLGDDEEHRTYALTKQEESMLFVDLNCDSKRGLTWGEYVSSRGLGIRMSGQLVNKLRPGDPNVSKWWH